MLRFGFSFLPACFLQTGYQMTPPRQALLWACPANKSLKSPGPSLSRSAGWRHMARTVPRKATMASRHRAVLAVIHNECTDHASTSTAYCDAPRNKTVAMNIAGELRTQSSWRHDWGRAYALQFRAGVSQRQRLVCEARWQSSARSIRKRWCNLRPVKFRGKLTRVEHSMGVPL